MVTAVFIIVVTDEKSLLWSLRLSLLLSSLIRSRYCGHCGFIIVIAFWFAMNRCHEEIEIYSSNNKIYALLVNRNILLKHDYFSVETR